MLLEAALREIYLLQLQNVEDDMASKPDLKQESSLVWNRYNGKTPDLALEEIYKDAHALSKDKRSWYWRSIKDKRWISLTSRVTTFGLLLFGTALPLLAGLSDNPGTRLLCTQIAITLLAAAGLFQLADKIFGWSTGWMRYVTTVTAMESATTSFDIEWAKHLLSKISPPDNADVQALFTIAETFERELDKLQSEETKGWIAEFNAGLSLLDSAIKSQREDTQKQLDSLNTTVANAVAAAKADAKVKADAEAAALKAKEPGAIDLCLTFKSDPKRVEISLDGATQEKIIGTSWSKVGIAPGLHTVAVRTLSEPIERATSSVLVKPNEIAKMELKLTT